MSFPNYAEYKDSGVEWIGQVPLAWRVMPIRLAARLESGHTPSRSRPDWWTNCTVPWFTLSDVWQIREAGADVIYETKEMVSALGLANSSARLLPRGTVMLSRTASVGFAAIMGRDMATTQDFANWVCGMDLLPEFLLMVFRSMRSEFDRLMIGSTHNTIYMPDIQSFRFALPSLAEQSAIVAFLKHETTKIDALVEEQRRLIELLKEKRQAVISQAVTKGLDPNVPMKDSGVEWLGQVPAHWKVLRVKDVARLESGHTPSKTVPEYWENCTIPWVSLNDSKQLAISDYITDTAFQINELGLANSSARMLPAGAVVFTRDATIGLAAITTRPMAVSQHLIAWCPSESIDAMYLLRVFGAMKRFLDSTTFGATIKTIGMADVKKLVTPVPPLAEQLKIAAAVDLHIRRINALVHDAELAVDLLRERRSALISAAVTGKIDVRGLAPQAEGAAA